MTSNHNSYSSSDRDHHNRQKRDNNHNNHHHDAQRRPREGRDVDDSYDDNKNNNNNRHTDRRTSSSSNNNNRRDHNQRDRRDHHHHHRNNHEEDDRDRRDRNNNNNHNHRSSRDHRDHRDSNNNNNNNDRHQDRDNRRRTSPNMASSSEIGNNSNKDNRRNNHSSSSKNNNDNNHHSESNSNHRRDHHHHQQQHRFAYLTVPRHYRCHICSRPGHWVVQCPILNTESFRKFFPHLSVSKGCGACGKKTSSHNDKNCPNDSVIVPCEVCGGRHIPQTSKQSQSAVVVAAMTNAGSSTTTTTTSSSLLPAVLPSVSTCPFARPPCTWYEFLDDKKTGLPYYVDADKKKAFEAKRQVRDGELMKKKQELTKMVMMSVSGKISHSVDAAPSVEKNTSVFDALPVSQDDDANNNIDKNTDAIYSTSIDKKQRLEELEQEVLRHRMQDVEEEQNIVTWVPPENPNDVIFWYCEPCGQLLPAEKYRKCPNCRTARFR